MANQRITNTLLTVTPTQAHTISTGQVGVVVRLEFLNLDTAAHSILVWFLPNGEILGNQHKVLALANASVIQPGKPLHMIFQAHLEEGDQIIWASDVASVIKAGGSVKEMTPGNAKNIKAQYLGTSLAELETVSVNFASTIISLLFCNQTGSPAGVEVQIVPQGQSAATKHRLLQDSDKIAAGATHIHRWPNHFEAAGASVQGRCETASAVVVAGGIFEEST